MRMKWFTGVLLVIFLAGCGDSGSSSSGEGRRTQIVEFLQEKMELYQIPGIVLTIDHPETGPMTIALGASEMTSAGDTPMDGDELFRIGSASKMFVAVTVLQLVQEEKLSLDDTVEHWLPGLLPDGANITVGQLTNHTAGIPSFTFHDDWLFSYVLTPEQTWTDEELVALVAEVPRINSPGQGWYYSNTHYVLLGMVIEAVTGNSWQTEIAARFKGELPTLQVPSGFTLEGKAAAGYIDWRQWLGMELDVLPVGLVEREGVDPSFISAAGILSIDMKDAMTWVRKVVEGEMLDAQRQEQLMAWVDIPGTTMQMGRGIIHEPDWHLLGHRGQISGYDCSLQYRYSTLEKLTGGAPLAICMNRSVAAVPGVSNINELILYDLVDLLFGETEAQAAAAPRPLAETPGRSRTDGSVLNSQF